MAGLEFKEFSSPNRKPRLQPPYGAILRAHSAHVAGAEVDGDDFTLEMLAGTASKEGVPSSDPVAGMETPERSKVAHN